MNNNSNSTGNLCRQFFFVFFCFQPVTISLFLNCCDVVFIGEWENKTKDKNANTKQTYKNTIFQTGKQKKQEISGKIEITTNGNINTLEKIVDNDENDLGVKNKVGWKATIVDSDDLSSLSMTVEFSNDGIGDNTNTKNNKNDKSDIMSCLDKAKDDRLSTNKSLLNGANLNVNNQNENNGIKNNNKFLIAAEKDLHDRQTQQTAIQAGRSPSATSTNSSPKLQNMEKNGNVNENVNKQNKENKYARVQQLKSIFECKNEMKNKSKKKQMHLSGNNYTTDSARIGM